MALEYVMMAGVNDGEEDAERLAAMTEGMDCVVNLIEFNTHEGRLGREGGREGGRGRGLTKSKTKTTIGGALFFCGTQALTHPLPPSIPPCRRSLPPVFQREN